MLVQQIIINCFLFFLGLMGITLNRKNILMTLMGIELMLLSSSLNFIIFSAYLNDAYGQLFAIFILTIAAAESAIGLAILIVSYKVRGTINITDNSILKG